mgnify:CR=1 FL=1
MGKGRTTGPIPAFPKGKERHSNALKHSKYGLPPLGEDWGGASGCWR